MSIKIIFPTPETVTRSGGRRLLEVKADTEAEIKALGSRVDDGTRVFYAAPGSMARTTDGSVTYEYGPAGEWVPQGSGAPSAPAEVVILPETELTYDAEEESFFIITPWETDPVVGSMYKVNYNGTDYLCECLKYAPDGAPDGIFVMGNLSPVGQSGGNADAPFFLMGYSLAFGEEMGGYGGFFALDGATTVTLSIVQTDGGSGAGNGLFTVKAITTDGSTVTVDKTYEEITAAVDAGKFGFCYLDLMGTQTLYLPLAARTRTSFAFSAHVPNADAAVTVKSDGTSELKFSITA